MRKAAEAAEAAKAEAVEALKQLAGIAQPPGEEAEDGRADGLQQMLSDAKAAEVAAVQTWSAAAQTADEMMPSNIRINPLLKELYGGEAAAADEPVAPAETCGDNAQNDTEGDDNQPAAQQQAEVAMGELAGELAVAPGEPASLPPPVELAEPSAEPAMPAQPPAEPTSESASEPAVPNTEVEVRLLKTRNILVLTIGKLEEQLGGFDLPAPNDAVLQESSDIEHFAAISTVLKGIDEGQGGQIAALVTTFGEEPWGRRVTYVGPCLASPRHPPPEMRPRPHSCWSIKVACTHVPALLPDLKAYAVCFMLPGRRAPS